MPDARTIWTFKEQLTRKNLYDKLFADFDKFLREKNLIMNQGVIIDGSFVEVPRQRNTREENKAIKEGRIFSFAAIMVVGNENGIVGYGLGKAREVSTAIQKGTEDAKKNLIQVPILKGTIPHAQEGKYSGSTVFMKPAAPGTGVIAGGAMRAVLESVGVKNVLAKSKGSSNPHSVVKATIDALSKMRDAYTVAQLRGVGLDKVFNG